MPLTNYTCNAANLSSLLKVRKYNKITINVSLELSWYWKPKSWYDKTGILKIENCNCYVSNSDINAKHNT